MKKYLYLLSVILSMAMVFPLVSCGSDDDDDGDGVNSGGKGKLVSQINVYSGSYLRQTITFYYDKKNRVTSADYSNDNAILGPGYMRIYFNLEGSTLTLSSCPSGESNPTRGVDGDGYGEGKLNSMGLLTEENFENYSYELESGDYTVCRYEHNSKGQCTSYAFYSSPRDAERDRSSDRCTYTWENDCIKRITGNPGGANYASTPSYTDIENKANINLNLMFMDQLYSEDIFGLALCGYISSKDKFLLSSFGNGSIKWQVDSQGYVTKAEYSGYSYEISYTK